MGRRFNLSGPFPVVNLILLINFYQKIKSPFIGISIALYYQNAKSVLFNLNRIVFKQE